MTTDPRESFVDWMLMHKASVLAGMSRREQDEFTTLFGEFRMSSKAPAAGEPAHDDASALLAKATVFKISDEIEVQARGNDTWCVKMGGTSVLNTFNEREYEASPSNRDDGFIARTRFTLAEAMRRAEMRAAEDAAEHQRRMRVYRRKKALNRLPWQKRSKAAAAAQHAAQNT